MGFVELVEVGYSLPDGRTLFQKVSFKVPDGQRVALVGANGVGKTTLLRLVAEPGNDHEGLIRVIGRLARMPQMVHEPGSPALVREALLQQAPLPLRAAGTVLVAAERRLAAASAESAGAAYADALHQWSELGGYDLEVTWNEACMAAMDQPFEAVGKRVASTLLGASSNGCCWRRYSVPPRGCCCSTSQTTSSTCSARNGSRRP